MASNGKVWFVGAGPGDPELLTVKAKRLIDAAEVIVFPGSLMPEANRAAVFPSGAELHDSAKMSLDEFMPILVNAARQGKRVVRLGSGDPSIYGALGEQTQWLEREGVSYEVVPGVSSFLAAAAAIAHELTVPDVVQSVILTRSEGRTKMPEGEKLADLARHKATMAIFLSTQMVDSMQKDLLAAYPEDTPVVVVHRVSWPDQKVIRCALKDLAARVRQEKAFLTSMVIVSPGLAAKGKKSKLYDSSFSHGFRRARKGGRADAAGER